MNLSLDILDFSLYTRGIINYYTMNTKQYLASFFEEKKIPYKIFEIIDKSNTVHFIDTDVVIESIHSAPKTEQTQIANVIRRIDFKNGDICHFLKFLAHGLVKQYEAAI